jgi:hypothetical protein
MNDNNIWLSGMMGLIVGDALGVPVQFMTSFVHRGGSVVSYYHGHTERCPEAVVSENHKADIRPDDLPGRSWGQERFFHLPRLFGKCGRSHSAFGSSSARKGLRSIFQLERDRENLIQWTVEDFRETDLYRERRNNYGE